MLLIFRDLMGRSLVTENSNLISSRHYILHGPLTTDDKDKHFENLSELINYLDTYGTNDYLSAIISSIRNFFDHQFELHGQMDS